MTKSPDSKSKKSNKSPAKAKKEIAAKPPKKTAKDAGAEAGADTGRDSDKRETYGQMVAHLFQDEFNKSRKNKENGVTYQQIWKSMQEKFPHTHKDKFLQRLKKLVNQDHKEGKLVKTEQGRYKFTASELFKP
jgi:hypothetical protein